MSERNKTVLNLHNARNLLVFFAFSAIVFSNSLALAAPKQHSPNPTSITQTSTAPELQQGLKAFADLDYQKAETIFQSVLADPQFVSETRAQAALHLGIIAMSQGAETKTRTFFLQAIELDPNIKLAADESPKLQGLFAEVRARMPKQEQASEPEQARAVQTKKPPQNSKNHPADNDRAATSSTAAIAPGPDKNVQNTKTTEEKEVMQNEKTWIWVAVIGGASIAVIAAGAGLYYWINSTTTKQVNPPTTKTDNCQAPDGQGCAVVHF